MRYYYDISIKEIRSKYIYKKRYTFDYLKKKHLFYKELNLNMLINHECTYYCTLFMIIDKNLKNSFRIVDIKKPTEFGTTITISLIKNLQDFYNAIKTINMYIKKINKKHNTKFWLYRINYDK